MATTAVRLECWSVASLDPERFRPPEDAAIVLHGKVYGHPRKPDGSEVSTSAMVDADGRLVWTKSGTCYELGEIDPEYLEYLQAKGIPYDPEKPIRVRGDR